ncbi:peptidoglycan-binding protein [Nitratireductor aquimarinus]|uniref:peptidoglycan-binding domain-containing protein n=1 Tax=Alphaproteobacteria TaxID=28211 RepID=UPI0019D3D72F|nr:MULTISPECIES: peptidoglycan-binding domain-containing protein [Alphaproteobacteria]MBN7758998.1 peptidoglycan-binding protein [Nitratireductor aquimarinus]MBY6001671.1 peptidoglycan-binding protein [Tritonibacter mobilis]MBY6023959.1 peptidoglycan-binding protein [Nitratireductor sp. DP7N14-4]
MTWRLARSLGRLREQINAAAPLRSKASDGTIGDAAHASRSSDHNPWVKDGATGVVTALDITHDPAAGVDIQKLADALVASKDRRIKYIICNGRIVSGAGQKQPAWKWRAYGGSNPHSRHIHISVKASKALYDDERDWRFDTAEIAELAPSESVLRIGSRGPFVKELQENLARLGYVIRADGRFGDETDRVVRMFQRQKGLKVDGWAGPRTLDAVGRAIAELASKPKIEAARENAKEQAAEQVERKTGWWQNVTGFFGAGSVGGGLLWGVDWQTLLVITGAAILVMLLIVLLRRQIVAAVRDIREGLA